MILPKIQEKGKQIHTILNRQDIFVTFLILFVGLISFGLGRLSKESVAREPIELHTLFPAATAQAVPETQASKITPIPQQQGAFVASRNGSKYHLPWCSGAQRMKEENKIWFATAEEARAAGYSPAANCKGL